MRVEAFLLRTRYLIPLFLSCLGGLDEHAAGVVQVLANTGVSSVEHERLLEEATKRARVEAIWQSFIHPNAVRIAISQFSDSNCGRNFPGPVLRIRRRVTNARLIAGVRVSLGRQHVVARAERRVVG